MVARLFAPVLDPLVSFSKTHLFIYIAPLVHVSIIKYSRCVSKYKCYIRNFKTISGRGERGGGGKRGPWSNELRVALTRDVSLPNPSQKKHSSPEPPVIPAINVLEVKK